MAVTEIDTKVDPAYKVEFNSPKTDRVKVENVDALILHTICSETQQSCATQLARIHCGALQSRDGPRPCKYLDEK